MSINVNKLGILLRGYKIAVGQGFLAVFIVNRDGLIIDVLKKTDAPVPPR